MAIRFAKKDDALKQQRESERQEAYDHAVAAAQNCLNTEDFKKYRDHYEKLERICLRNLMDLDRMETDPVKYGFQAKDIISCLRHVRILLELVNQDAGK